MWWGLLGHTKSTVTTLACLKEKSQWRVVAGSRICALHRLCAHSAVSNLYHVGDINELQSEQMVD